MHGSHNKGVQLASVPNYAELSAWSNSDSIAIAGQSGDRRLPLSDTNRDVLAVIGTVLPKRRDAIASRQPDRWRPCASSFVFAASFII